MSHRIKQKTVTHIRGKSRGDCPTCGHWVEVVKVLNSWQCKANLHAKQKAAAKKAAQRTKAPRKGVQAIRAVESKRALNATELKKLLRAELSRIVRARDEYRCFVCNAVVEPGIRAWQGQAAHLRPILKLPPKFRYDPNLCVWMCGTHHSEFDGNSFRGKVAAYQLPVWERLQREKPEVYKWLIETPIATGVDKSTACDLRDQLEALRAIQTDSKQAA